MIKSYTSFLDTTLTPHHLLNSLKVLLPEYNVITSFNSSMSPGKYILVKNTSFYLLDIPKGKIKGCKIIATHNDSPVMKLKPNFRDPKSETGAKNGYEELSLSFYGGGIWHTWFDRPLGIAGLTITENNEKIIITDDSSIVIPSLPPHLNDGSVYNKGFHYRPNFKGITKIGNIDGMINEKTISHDLMLYCLEKAYVDQKKQICLFK